MKKVLFVTPVDRRCGVSSFGASTGTVLLKSRRYEVAVRAFEENTEPAGFLDCVRSVSPDIILYNQHPIATPWLNGDVIAQIRWEMPHIKQLAEVHDQTPAIPTLDGLVHSNPIMEETLREFRVRRILPPSVDVPPPTEVVIGSFGFAGDHKGLVRLVEQVNDEFDRATVRLHLPHNHYGDPDGAITARIATSCRAAAKDGVRVEVTHDYLDPTQLVRWLAGNSINCFLYSEHPSFAVAGISSAIDYALAARRPIAVTRCGYFRHLAALCPSSLIENSSLKSILAHGFAPFEPLVADWTEANVLADYERIFDRVTQIETYNLRANRVLTAADRESLRPAVEELTKRCPEIMSRKHATAVFQNAFIYEQVRRAACKEDKIILIGGYEDPIGPALLQQGYDVRITDPNVDDKDARAVWEDTLHTGETFNIVISCSVLEHVAEDENFVRYIYQILSPGGVAFLTTDYRDGWKPGDDKPLVDERLYTRQRLEHLAAQLPDGSLLAPPAWNDEQPYFHYEGSDYCFASFAFRRREVEAESVRRHEHIYREFLGREFFEMQRLREHLERFKSVHDASPLTLRIAGKVNRVAKRMPLMRWAMRTLRSLFA